MSDVGEVANTTSRCLMDSPKRILVVDDDFETRQINSSALAHSGYEVDAAADGAVAWQSLNACRYDLLITNHRMPRMSGLELLMKLHGDRMALPVILVAAILPRDHFTRYPWLKPATTLLQPCSVADLLSAVDKVLRATRAAREQIAPTRIQQTQPSSHWFGNVMILLRSPFFR
jgi:DNA-binding NtrC family response regulator